MNNDQNPWADCCPDPDIIDQSSSEMDRSDLGRFDKTIWFSVRCLNCGWEERGEVVLPLNADGEIIGG